MKSIVLNGLLLGGYGAMCLGLAQWWPPAAWIAGGTLAMAGAVCAQLLTPPNTKGQ